MIQRSQILPAKIKVDRPSHQSQSIQSGTKFFFLVIVILAMVFVIELLMVEIMNIIST